MATNKKVTRVEGGSSSSETTTRTPFVPTEDAKGKATQLRVFAGLLWLGAILAQLGAIYFVLKQATFLNLGFMTWTIILIVVDLAFAIGGAVLWKKSNRLDPASEKNGFLFFMQNQLGVVVAFIAFLPLILVILTNKNIDKKQKAILGGIAGVALVIAGVSSADFNPPSVEQYTEQTARVEDLTGGNLVYWTKSGRKYHLSDSCSYINGDKTSEILSGTVAQARELKNITELCSLCESRAAKAKGLLGGQAASEVAEPTSSSEDAHVPTPESQNDEPVSSGD